MAANFDPYAGLPDDFYYSPGYSSGGGNGSSSSSYDPYDYTAGLGSINSVSNSNSAAGYGTPGNLSGAGSYSELDGRSTFKPRPGLYMPGTPGYVPPPPFRPPTGTPWTPIDTPTRPPTSNPSTPSRPPTSNPSYPPYSPPTGTKQPTSPAQPDLAPLSQTMSMMVAPQQSVIIGGDRSQLLPFQAGRSFRGKDPGISQNKNRNYLDMLRAGFSS